jgi:alpha-galactosidase
MQHLLLKTLAAIGAASGCVLAVAQATETVWLDSLDLKSMHQGYGTPQVNRSIREQPLAIGGQKFVRGVGTHALSTYRLTLNGGTERFTASVGLDDAAGEPGSVVFQLIADQKKVFDSGVMKSGQAAKRVDVELRGVTSLILTVTDAGDGVICDHADWANAQFTVTAAKPAPGVAPYEAPYLLTPKPSLAPRLNGTKIYGARPGHPFLYRIPAQGERPMNFTASGLPKGLQLDAQTGIITGTTPARGEYNITFRAKNSRGKDHRSFKLASGDTLSLTPQMGWNSWYAYYARVTDTKMREAADTMIHSGMADVGYQYVNIDACWAVNPALTNEPAMQVPPRDATGNIMPNRNFPDMKAMTDYVHGQGLKAGLYSSPGPWDCMLAVGAWLHEEQDAQSYAKWGFDFLKYDWCSYDSVAGKPRSLDEMKRPYPTIPPTFNFASDRPLDELKRPYQLMGELLRQQPRDIVFNLCQYGMGDVWKWGAEAGGQSWRTGGDLGNELNRIFEVALKNCEHRDWQKPGAWNDPDYIQIGFVGSAAVMGLPAPCPLTPTEQYSFMSLWALMASPLFYSGDMSKLDEFTLNVLCNLEVIEVNQDSLGQCARVVTLDEDTFLLVKDLADGTQAVGLCNRSEDKVSVTAKWSDVGVEGKPPVRDLWRQKDLGKFSGEFKAAVPRRGVMLVKVGKPSSN